MKDGIFDLGLVMLLLTPVARGVVDVLFAEERRYVFVTTTVLVLRSSR